MTNLSNTLTPEELQSANGSCLPKNIFLGTSTWTFPGWRGTIYKGEYKSDRDFSRRCVEEYAAIPWFRTACIDSLFYNPPSPTTLRRYATQVPESGVTHCFTHWNSMTRLREQMKTIAVCGGLKADFYVARLLTPLGLSYEGAAKLFEPYDKVLRPNPQMRADVVTFPKRALSTGKRAFVTANNKADGNSALSMATIGALILSELEKTPS
jgi:hypothetical protein